MNVYDLLKIVALLTMIIDHTGEYFYPDWNWLRAIGRMAFPLFLFLVGYSHRFTIKSDIIIGCLVLVAVDAWTFYPIFAVNVLASILAARVFLAWVEKKGLLAKPPWPIVLVLLVWYPVSFVLFEYGSIAFLFAMVGYYARNTDAVSKMYCWQLLVFTMIIHSISESLGFHFNLRDNLIMIAALLCAAYAMLHVSLKPLPVISNAAQGAIKLLSRHTLLIYVLHVTAFQIIETLLHPGPTDISRWIY